MNRASTRTTLTTSIVGQQVALTATVAVLAPGAGTPRGIVQFFDGGASLGTATIISSGGAFTATLEKSLGSGPHSLKAVYGGSDNFNSSESPPRSVRLK